MAYRGFPAALLDTILCQNDAGRLRVEGSSPAAIVGEGQAACDACGSRYEIRDGILDLLERQPSIDPINARERSARDRTRPIPLDPALSDPNLMEIETTLRQLEPVAGCDILDLGCGWGRVTTHFVARARRVLAVDFSRALLDSCATRMNGAGNVGLVLADASQIRLKRDSFDRVLSSQVLEHIPTPDRRAAFYERVAQALRLDGLFVATVYHRSLIHRLRRQPADGFHENGIYYHCFHRSELARDVAPYFTILDLRPIRVEIPFVSRIRLRTRGMSRILEHVPILRDLGRLLLVRGRKTAP